MTPDESTKTLETGRKRPSKDVYYLGIAKAVLRRSTCLRRQYGAVIVKDDEIIATGYNGSPRGEENCIDVGICWRRAHNIEHGERQELCRAVHAEENAVISASRHDMQGSTLYLYGMEDGRDMEKPEPCIACKIRIKNAGIARVVTIANAERGDTSDKQRPTDNEK